ncbi:hypothetical protein EYZ11_000457 [Aspergillus tanneri]|uniref:HTH La-type RNA-binding domain-containing protein n=1 Tax=Aspergillus tanneri TaxID=1220188 RepID=A0A4S3JWX7_9EURO|nr:hypothetical protein EYZ11_000457 [Aspergillus tanneri]
MATTFSYAQAAKGIASTAPTMITAESNNATKPDGPNSGVQVENSVSSKAEASQEAENVTAIAGKDSETAAPINSKANASGTSSPSVGNSSSTSTIAKDEDLSTPNGTSESTWDKQSQDSGTDKPRNGDETPKDKLTGEKEKNEPPKELKAAPLPSVNVWQQRKEAQEAKAKAVASLKPANSESGSVKTGSTASSISGNNQQDQPKAATRKKGGDTEGKDRKRAVRDESVTVPPVEDAASWPTPQVAQGEEKRKAQEKGDKTEKSEKSPVIRPHGKEKWMPVPYVPTAVFNTPLPSAARRGGRAARGGRDGARNGAHGAGASTVDKAASGQVAQGSGKATTTDRGRNEPNSARANSLPATSRRSNSTDAGSADPRKSQAADRSRAPKGADSANAAPAGRHGDTFPRNHRDAKAFKNHESGHKGDHGSKNPNLSVDAQAGPRNGSSHDRRFENGPRSADFAGFYGDRKDKEFSRESRAERGRGSHRGRGGFGGSQNSNFPNNHMSHSSFMHQKSYGFSDRQRPQHGLANGSQGHRMSLRSPSLPNSASMYGVYPFPADINTMYGYQPMHAGPMTAAPYPQYMEPYSLMSMVSFQLEYYFSVDNLCKDLFLRKHMDSQGFVDLAFIATFKRIKTLTEDFEFLRLAARQLRNVEHVAGEDGVDRLRAREWEQWVLPLNQRDPSAQNSGTSPAKQSKADEGSTPQSHVDGATNGSTSHQSLSNGIPKTSLSSDAPEFSPAKATDAPAEYSGDLANVLT